MSIKSRNFDSKSKYWASNVICVKNFCQKSKFLSKKNKFFSKKQISVKNRNFCQKTNFRQKSKFLTKKIHEKGGFDISSWNWPLFPGNNYIILLLIRAIKFSAILSEVRLDVHFVFFLFFGRVNIFLVLFNLRPSERSSIFLTIFS